eukprot:gene23284-30519_t
MLGFADSNGSGILGDADVSASMNRVNCPPGFREGALLKIPSLVFDIELEDGGVNCRNANVAQQCALIEDLKVVNNFLLPSCDAELHINQDVEAANAAKSTPLDAPELAELLSDSGYSVTARTALGGGEGSDCLRNLRHSFVIAEPPGCQEGSRIIIDPQFKAQFVIAKPTERYSAICNALPDCLVMREDCITQLVTFLCMEVMAAFEAHDVMLPPWRQVDSMLSKWLPRKASDDNYGGSQPAAWATAGYKPLIKIVKDQDLSLDVRRSNVAEPK